MTHPLTRVPFLGPLVDEHFLEHRRRASSIAGFAATLLAIVLFEYRYFHDHVLNRDLLSIALVFVFVKLGMFLWYRFNA